MIEVKDLFAINLAFESKIKSAKEVFYSMIERIVLDIAVIRSDFCIPVNGYLVSKVSSMIDRIKDSGEYYNEECLDEVMKLADENDEKYVSMVVEAYEDGKTMIDISEFK